MMLNRDQIRKYFEARLQGQRLSASREINMCCPFHEDRNPSMSLNTEKGVWKCHAGCGEGGLLAFEMKFSKCDESTAKGNISDLLGEGRLFSVGQQPEAVYQYQDASGRHAAVDLVAHQTPLRRQEHRQPDLLEANLYINTRKQSAELMLDNEEQVGELVLAMKQRQIEFAIFDVFNVMHAADENDNTEMRRVLRQLSKIQAEVGCGIGVVHHLNKAESGSMTQRLRGSSTIAGWAEWLIGISLVNEEQKIRRMEFELKAAQPPNPISFQILSNDANGVASLVKCDMPISARGASRAAELIRQ